MAEHGPPGTAPDLVALLNAVPSLVAEAKQACLAVSGGGALRRPIDTPTADLLVWVGAVPTVARRRPPDVSTSEPPAATVAEVLVAHLRPAAAPAPAPESTAHRPSGRGWAST
ncbi:MAG TPA: hypothetical protein VM264_09595, partial [Acidimicrobiales bacterium]|nr:hypothetical protein [Acidimicrobiales bacterium]